MPPKINAELCIACGKCVLVCPEDVIWGDEVPSVLYPEECWHCYACKMECPVEGALEIVLRVEMKM